MANGMPELGSKISLISKADIRYEGRLFTVDPTECTIALATVRSFGTEDRETQFPVAPQSQVYDYILFRGSDIKDIRVVNNVNALPNDPAIMQLSVPPTLSQQTYQPQGFAHPVLGAAMGSQMNQYGAGYGPLGGLPPAIPPTISNRAPIKQTSELPNEEPPTSVHTDPGVRESPHASVLELLSGGSRSATPANLQNNRKSPTMDQSVQATPILPQVQKGRPQAASQRGANQKDQIFPGQQRERRESRGESQVTNEQRPNSQNKLTNQQPGAAPQQGAAIQQNQQPRGNWGGRPNNMRQRGRGRGQQNNFRSQGNGMQAGTGNNQRPKNTLKFENDYDFEQANTEFEELRSQLAKVKVSEETKTETINGEVDKKDDSGNETGAGENEPEEETEVCYDKTKSFFDNISCEAVERSKGRSQRTDWRTERKLNSETFGVASARRGGYRGRGGYYNRGMGNMYHRGGYRGNYRNNRGRNQQQHQNNQLQQPARTQAVPVAAGN